MIVSHVDEIPDQYAKALDKAKSRDELLQAVKLYGEVAIDAVEIVEKMDDGAFDDWQAALKKERRGTFMGEAAMERFGPLLMPETMFKVSMVADQFKVPWGLAYNRLVEVKRLVVKDGVAMFRSDGKTGAI